MASVNLILIAEESTAEIVFRASILRHQGFLPADSRCGMVTRGIHDLSGTQSYMDNESQERRASSFDMSTMSNIEQLLHTSNMGHHVARTPARLPYSKLSDTPWHPDSKLGPIALQLLEVRDNMIH
jgi:hypothetical protein